MVVLSFYYAAKSGPIILGIAEQVAETKIEKKRFSMKPYFIIFS
jgi:hypothetical protein